MHRLHHNKSRSLSSVLRRRPQSLYVASFCRPSLSSVCSRSWWGKGRPSAEAVGARLPIARTRDATARVGSLPWLIGRSAAPLDICKCAWHAGTDGFALWITSHWTERQYSQGWTIHIYIKPARTQLSVDYFCFGMPSTVGHLLVNPICCFVNAFSVSSR